MEKFIYYNELYLIYKNLLNDNYQDIFDLYYGDNLTMQEIADIKDMSKARVGVIIKNTENTLDKYEKTLHILKRNEKLKELLELNDIDKIKKEVMKIVKGEE